MLCCLLHLENQKILRQEELPELPPELAAEKGVQWYELIDRNPYQSIDPLNPVELPKFVSVKPDGFTILGRTLTKQYKLAPWSPEQVFSHLEKEITTATQQRLDDFAKTRNYDGILSACTYATSTVQKFQAEGQYCVNARDATWAKLYQIMSDVQAGIRQPPMGYADIEVELPLLEWPL